MTSNRIQRCQGVDDWASLEGAQLSAQCINKALALGMQQRAHAGGSAAATLACSGASSACSGVSKRMLAITTE